MSGAPQVAMRSASQSWQSFFPSQTLQVICFSFAKPLDFLFGPSQKGTICSSAPSLFGICDSASLEQPIQTLEVLLNPLPGFLFYGIKLGSDVIIVDISVLLQD
jgi:hypothetical protein